MKTDLSQFEFITRPTLSAVEAALSFDNIVLYAILHEAVYCQGRASNWAADRVGKSLKEYQWLSGTPQPASAVREHPLYFSGEMIFPFLFDTFPELQELSRVADILAQHSEWPQLYNEWQLARNDVPVCICFASSSFPKKSLLYSLLLRRALLLWVQRKDMIRMLTLKPSIALRCHICRRYGERDFHFHIPPKSMGPGN
jgi:hypothetical protein